MGRHHASATTVVDAASIKAVYAPLLRGLMTAMRETYQVISADNSSTKSSTYVPFCHRIITLLLKHTAVIIPLDPFFTDSLLFPILELYPGCIVSHLKKSSRTLSFPNNQEQLTTFVHTLSERAAVKSDQAVLITQLSMALGHGFEHGDNRKPTTRQYFLQVLLPAYIEYSITHPAGYLICAPLLHVLNITVARVSFAVDSASFPSSSAALNMLRMTTDSIGRAVSAVMVDDITTARVLGVLTLLLRVVAEGVTLLSWLAPEVDGDEAEGEHLDRSTVFLLRFTLYARGVVTGLPEYEAPRPVILAMPSPSDDFEVARTYAKNGLRKILEKLTRREDGWAMGRRVLNGMRVDDMSKIRGDFLAVVDEVLAGAERGRFSSVVCGWEGRGGERRRVWARLGLEFVI
jgi:hypothetical protein